jgi:molybdenum cofactor cytidylyltransferase
LWKSLAAYPNLDAVILLTCDQPLVDREIIIGLKTKREETKKPIIASRHASTLGIPALFDRAYFDELLDNEAGSKSVIFSHTTDVAEYSFNDGAIDIDTAADYERLIRSSS